MLRERDGGEGVNGEDPQKILFLSCGGPEFRSGSANPAVSADGSRSWSVDLRAERHAHAVIADCCRADPLGPPTSAGLKGPPYSCTWPLQHVPLARATQHATDGSRTLTTGKKKEDWGFLCAFSVSLCLLQ